MTDTELLDRLDKDGIGVWVADGGGWLCELFSGHDAEGRTLREAVEKAFRKKDARNGRPASGRKIKSK